MSTIFNYWWGNFYFNWESISLIHNYITVIIIVIIIMKIVIIIIITIVKIRIRITRIITALLYNWFINMCSSVSRCSETSRGIQRHNGKTPLYTNIHTWHGYVHDNGYQMHNTLLENVYHVSFIRDRVSDKMYWVCSTSFIRYQTSC